MLNFCSFLDAVVRWSVNIPSSDKQIPRYCYLQWVELYFLNELTIMESLKWHLVKIKFCVGVCNSFFVTRWRLLIRMTRIEGGLFPIVLRSSQRKVNSKTPRMTRGRATKWAKVVDVRWEQEHVQKILASAAALQAETIHLEWNEDDDDFSDVLTAMEMDKIRITHRYLCWGCNNQHSLGNGRNLCHNWRRSFHFGLTSDVESTGCTIDDDGMLDTQC